MSLAKAIGDVLHPTSDFVLDMLDRAEAAAKSMTWETNSRKTIAVYQDALTNFTMTQKRGFPTPLEDTFNNS